MFNAFDIAVLAVILLTAYFGSKTGIIASIFYVASSFVGMFVAHRYADAMGLNFYVAFLVSAAVVILIGYLIGKLMKAFFLGLFDRLGGAVLGLVLGVLIAATVLVPVASRMPEKARATAMASYTVARIGPSVRRFVPQSHRLKVEEVRDNMDLPKLPQKLNLKVTTPSKPK
jgi:uncharacterized membrane protein required for colicin V production